MTRAAETAGLIQEFLPGVPTASSDLLREGAPIPPEPPVGHWRPEAQVRFSASFSWSLSCVWHLLSIFHNH